MDIPNEEYISMRENIRELQTGRIDDHLAREVCQNSIDARLVKIEKLLTRYLWVAMVIGGALGVAGRGEGESIYKAVDKMVNSVPWYWVVIAIKEAIGA